ncbi:MAG: efflux transporter outer membrane subunit [Kiritimatiellae bacterium]|nr:efflux transporter outer membrane subunit [Kiritimatiellia bacterium]
MKGSIWLFALVALGVAGCFSVGPDYREPEVKKPVSELTDAGLPLSSNKMTQAERVTISAEEVSAWWTIFKDEKLTWLVNQAFASNLTMRVAAMRVREARAQLAIARGKWEPSLDLSGGYTRDRTSANGKTGLKLTRNDYMGGFDASWEIDIFGGTRRNVEAARADLDAEIAALDQAWVSLAAEVGVNYMDLLTMKERLVVAHNNLKIQQETLDILASRNKAGIGDDLAVQQAKYNVETTRATIPNLQVQIESYLNSLAILTGQEPGTLHEALKDVRFSDPIPPRRLTGIDAELLRRRPDIRQAERNLAAQCARIGVAEAELYPHFYLTGSVGLESLKASNLFKSESLYWNFGPSFSWSIFNGNTVRANIDIQDARYQSALATYQQTLLSAQGEIRDALTAYVQEFHRFEALTRAVEAAQSAVNISQDLYKNGLRDFNNVLDSERSLLTLQESFTISEGNIAMHLIKLYKAMGGGWASWMDEPPKDPKPVEPILN